MMTPVDWNLQYNKFDSKEIGEGRGERYLDDLEIGSSLTVITFHYIKPRSISLLDESITTHYM
jgi:hypothetical protein